MRKVYLMIALLALLAGLYLQQTGCSAAAFPKVVQPHLIGARTACTSFVGGVGTKLASLKGKLNLWRGGLEGRGAVGNSPIGGGEKKQAGAGQPPPAPPAQEFAEHSQYEGVGTVVQIWPDDVTGNRRQRFVLRLASGQNVLIAHNIDLAPRLKALRLGDSVSFFGEYDLGPRGGFFYWTHKDPAGRHVAGWLKHNGHVYQ